MKKWFWHGSALALILSTPVAMAQGPAPAEQTIGLEEIIVTASRRSLSVQKTAIAVTAVSADELAAKGVSDVTELTNLAPAVKIGQNAGSGVQITVRGVGNFGGNSFAEPGVAVNLDGVYLARAPAASGVFYDVERVEILKGPQGTLYGRNSTGGVVNIITRNPTDELGGEVTAEIGNYNLYRGSAALNLPLTDKIAVRVAGQGVSRDGYLTDGYNDDKGYAGRVKLKVAATEDLTILLEGDLTRTKGKGSNGVFVPYVADNEFTGPSDPRSNALFNAGPPILPRITDKGFLNNEARGLQATIDYNLDFATATVIAANRTSTADYLHYSAGFPVTDYNRDDPSETSTVEFRLASSGGGPLKWVVGGFFFDDNLHTRISPDQGTTFAAPDIRVDTLSWSGFGEATYSITDTIRVTAGGRYTADDKEISGTQTSAVVAPPPAYPIVCPAAAGAVIIPGPVQNPSRTNTYGATCRAPVAGQADFNKFTWKLGVEADIADQSLLYATVATGFKAGGFYASLNTAPDSSFPNNAYRPETLTAYTVGSKNRFLDNRLQVNGEAFYWDYKDKQVPHIGIVQPGNNINLIVENAAAAEVYGAELDALWEVNLNGQLNIGLQYLHARYNAFQYNVVVPAFAANPNARPATGCSFSPVVSLAGPGTPGVSRVDCSNREMPFSPEWVLNLGYRHTFDLDGGATIVAGISTHIESAFQVGEEYLPGQRQKSSMMTDLELTWNSADLNYALTAYVQNLEDEAVAATGFVQPTLGVPLSVLRAPRTYGVRMRASF